MDLDVLRGLALCIIFINHVPGNVFERLTPKNIGFSDSAEAFVFLSGLSLALAYASRFRDGRAWKVVQSLRARVVRLYGLHLLLTLAAVSIYALGASLGENEEIMTEHGRDLFIEDPWAALSGLVTLGHQLGYFNILPLYIVLIGFFLAQLLLIRVGVAAMLGSSAGLYVLARTCAWNIPTWPMKGSWFFNPLTWQLLMGLGVASAVLWRRGALPRRPAPAVVATTIVLASSWIQTDGFGLSPGLQEMLRPALDCDKGSLGLGRLVHFLAVAYLVYWANLGAAVASSRAGLALGRLGRHSLPIFAVLSVLAAAGQVAMILSDASVQLDIFLIGGGLMTMFGVARLLEARSLGLPITTRLGTEPRRSA